MKIAYGNYGMLQTPYATMIQQVAHIGYDGIEICTAPNYPTAPSRLDNTDRRHIRSLLGEYNLEVAALMVVGIEVLKTDAHQHATNLTQLRHIFELGRDIGLQPTIVVSTLGRRTDDWGSMRGALIDCVSGWTDIAAEYEGIFAIEPHVGGIVHSPDRCLWVLGQVNSPNLKVNFDYSHFELIDIPLAEAVSKLIPHAVGTHVKDVSGRPPDFRFLLPGAGNLDYAHYVREVAAAGYDGFITVEISGQVFNAHGYDELEAAKFSYQTLADAFTQVGLQHQ